MKQFRKAMALKYAPFDYEPSADPAARRAGRAHDESVRGGLESFTG